MTSPAQVQACVLRRGECEALTKSGAPCAMVKGLGWISGASMPVPRYLCPGHWKSPPKKFRKRPKPPGHWIGCTLDLFHKGDCVVTRATINNANANGSGRRQTRLEEIQTRPDQEPESIAGPFYRPKTLDEAAKAGLLGKRVITDAIIDALAKKHNADRRSFWRRLAGLPVRGRRGEIVDRALRSAGYEPRS